MSFLTRTGEVALPWAQFAPGKTENGQSRKHTGNWKRWTALLAAILLGLRLGGSTVAEAAQQKLHGHVPAITTKLTPVSRLEASRPLDIAIGLPLRNRESLTNLLEQLYQPSHPNFRHYLSPEEFTASFGPSQEDYRAIQDFAKAHGLTVKRTHPNRTLLDVSGSVADIEKAFHVKMRVYQHPTEARTFFAPDAEPTVDLAAPVLAISGLDDYVRPKPGVRPSRSVLLAQAARTKTRAARPEAIPLGGGGGGGGASSGGSGSGGSYLGYDFRAAYADGVTQDGTGQYVGLFELSGYAEQDVLDYESEAGLPNVPLENILIDDFDGDDSNYQYSIEVTGDIEMAISMAPGLDGVLVYEGPTPDYLAPLGTSFVQYSSTTAQINDVLNRMATDNRAKQLSCSYGMDVNTSTSQIFQQFAAQGQSFFQGSGDFGAYPGAVDSPSDNPYVTVVGGTTLNTAGPEAGWVSEVVWLTPASNDPLLGYSPEQSSGGGVSLAYEIPIWQQGISMTENQGSTTMRNLPDVALVADNIDLVWGNDYLGSSYDLPEGGTSLATPLWAAFIALVNQQAAANGQPPVGFINPALYAIGKSGIYTSCFHDITSGNNFSTASPNLYNSTTGYDLCSGWGTIIGTNLMQALLAPPSENLVVTPPLGFTSSGQNGGPFTVASETYTLTNIGSTPLQWSLANTSIWLTAIPAGGTLTPGGPAATVKVTLNAAATNFLIGNYSGNVVFTDGTDGVTQNRQFDLYVGNGGFESGDFTGWTMIGSTDLVFALAADDVDVAGTNALSGVPDATFVHSGLYGAYLGEWADQAGDPAVGSLSQTVPAEPEARYRVSFWLTSAAYQGKTTPNSFAARWNDLTLYSQTNLPAFGWTNMQYLVTSTRTNGTVEFDFSNVPAGFGLDDVRVETLPPPVFESASVNAGSVLLSWSGLASVAYQLQSTTNLASPNWVNTGLPIIATNNTVSVSEPLKLNPGAPQFYRVLILPAP